MAMVQNTNIVLKYTIKIWSTRSDGNLRGYHAFGNSHAPPNRMILLWPLTVVGFLAIQDDGDSAAMMMMTMLMSMWSPKIVAKWLLFVGYPFFVSSISTFTCCTFSRNGGVDSQSHGIIVDPVCNSLVCLLQSVRQSASQLVAVVVFIFGFI